LIGRMRSYWQIPAPSQKQAASETSSRRAQTQGARHVDVRLECDFPCWETGPTGPYRCKRFSAPSPWITDRNSDPTSRVSAALIGEPRRCKRRGTRMCHKEHHASGAVHLCPRLLMKSLLSKSFEADAVCQCCRGGLVMTRSIA
jgi:hypothetical protein